MGTLQRHIERRIIFLSEHTNISRVHFYCCDHRSAFCKQPLQRDKCSRRLVCRRDRREMSRLIVGTVAPGAGGGATASVCARPRQTCGAVDSCRSLMVAAATTWTQAGALMFLPSRWRHPSTNTFILPLGACVPVMVYPGAAAYGVPQPHVPEGHRPPPGACRVWYPDRPAGHQPPPGPCNKLRHRMPPGAVLVYG